MLNPACRSEAGNGSSSEKPLLKSDVEVYYFHFTHRCVTCKAIEEVTSEVVSEYAGSPVSFTSYNLEEKDGKEIAAQYNITGQTLLLVSGEKVINLTNDAFLNARNNPEKFRELLRREINKLTGE